ncbi:beta-N-acetylhexosaminidase [Rhodobacter aestuarii]|uniref:beta-N-acetylhexosaminidase n=1 Tax=Rhodobacter aestuarii TaxID=453582 RepID=A0A1N7KS17_9RHOB|nr:beta-N-acetylhexosaminidase [Rhodobacter aestuarii]PTV95604.1 beta-N-acetylhexosaminidase [Rhodobacter aestuarii]SIS64296.1 beta-N-acetylhexosaminidase [Rhodobacter aestuarii]
MSQPGATILGLEGLELRPDEAAFLREADPWGLILFARNVESPAQLSRLTARVRDALGRDAPIFVDQEGGRVQRLRAPHWREWLPPFDEARATGPRGLWLRARLQAAELRAVGIDGNCAPTCDIAGPRTHPFLHNRCMGETVAEVVQNARATAEGLLAGGMLPVIKHMPGHGRAEADSHKDLPTVAATADDLRARDFAVFTALNDLPLGMTAHIRFPAFDAAPATQSAKMIDLIRQEIGFAGLLMTDDITMQALTGSYAERAKASLTAGCDVVLHCNGTRAEMAETVAAAGALSPAAALRAEAALRWRHSPEEVDLDALSAEFENLSHGKMDG